VVANLNFGIDCENAEVAHAVSKSISALNIYQDQLDVCDERVSLISKQSLLEELDKLSKNTGASLSVECWPEDQDYDEAEDAGTMECYTYG
jgi:hypothetical protein